MVKKRKKRTIMGKNTIKMTKEEAIKKLLECQEMYDTESAHGNADNVLCTFLKSLGYGDVVKEYKKVDKWYG